MSLTVTSITPTTPKENVDKLLELANKMHQKREAQLSALLPQYQNELKELPQILKIRMNALKEVNPKEFSDSPDLVLSTLAVAELIKQFPDGADKLQKDDMEKVYEKYHIINGGDINQYLVPEIFFAYFNDVKSGAITKSGQIIDIEKSNVMRVYHNNKSDGVPIDAEKTVANIKKLTRPSNTRNEIGRD